MWLYNGKEFTKDMIADNLGFVYVITNLSNGMKYIGQKKFSYKKTRQKNKKKIKVLVASDDWKSYFGSNKVLAEDVRVLGEINFRREILYLCKTKSEMNYWETYEQLVNHAIPRDDYYNDWFMTRIAKKHLKGININRIS